MFTIAKEFAFSASHRLEGLPAGHQCSRLHGHNYVVTFELEADTLDDRGFVVDYGDLSPFKVYIDHVLDHRDLNEALPMLASTTAENLAMHLWHQFCDQFLGLVAVRVSETPKTWAEYRG